MKITIFTSNKSRHNYLVNLLSNNCEELFVVQECDTVFPGIVPSRYMTSNIMKKYFEKVNDAQNLFFGNSFINQKNNNINFLPLRMGDLNQCSIEFLEKFLQSDFYVVFGCSFIKGELVKFLIKNKAINIHMGISPYYRGNDCNFWALYDNNPHLVGATIHLLSKGLDSGPILYHAMSNIKTDPFIYTMSTVKSAFYSIAERIKNKSIFDYKPEVQDKLKMIRYTKDEFNEEVVNEFFRSEINLNSKNFDYSLLKESYFLEN